MPFDMNDLNALKLRDEAAWNRVYEVIWLVALNAANQHMGAYFPQDVEDIAHQAIIEFRQKGIDECNSPGGIIAFVQRIARCRAIAFVKKRMKSIVRDLEFQTQREFAEERPERRLSDRLKHFASQLFLFEVGADLVIEAIVAVLKLNELDRFLLVEHVSGELSQPVFAAKHGIRVNIVGARKRRVLEKIRRHVESPPYLRRFQEEIARRRRT
jgi:DNA-directed RNA polymerase specialized sigma24 family protein